MGTMIKFTPKNSELKPGLAKQMLDVLKKEDLTNICEDFKIEYKKSMSKAELCECIEKSILENPLILGERLSMDDLMILNQIVEAGGSILTDEDLFSLPLFGRAIVTLDLFDMDEDEHEEFYKFSIPDNLYRALKPVIKKMLADERLFELERREMLICGMAQLYGTISVKNLHKLLTESYDVVIDYKDLLSFLSERDRFMTDIQPFFIKEEICISNVMVEDPETFYLNIQKRKDLDYYPFLVEELLMQGEQDFFPVFDEADELLDYFRLENDDIEDCMENVVWVWELIQNETPLNEVLSLLTEEIDGGDINELTRLLIEFQNNVPRWSLKGHNPSEIYKSSNTDPLSKNPDLSNPLFQKSPSEPARAKVGRNDPCPCGSEKKFKKCCGKDL